MNNQEITKFTIDYVKTKNIDWKTLEKTYKSTDEDIQFNHNPFSLFEIQNYNPIYSKFFVLNEKNYNTISLNHRYHFLDTENIFDTKTNEIKNSDIFIKYSPLLDPYRFMTGKYKIYDIKQLPSPFLKDDEKNIPKINDYNNASYVDNFFSFLACKLMHQHQFIHSVDYYGSFVGIQNVFKINITDDLEFLQSSDYFLENINKKFILNENGHSDFMNLGSRSNKLKINISKSECHNITAQSLNDETIGLNHEEIEKLETEKEEVVYEKDLCRTTKSSSNDSSSDDSDDDDDDIESDNSNENINEEENDDDYEDIDSSEEQEEDDDDEFNRFAYVNNFPVQFICLEKCDGTFDELFMRKEVDDKIAASALFQIIMSLITYQKCFHFTHNDLHTNNIMFSNTDKKFIYYCYKKHYYKVPTYGKIFKIIDFGRSIYKFNGQIFCSDSFALGGDASTQYNTEPYLNENKARLDPNYSFDLCRLGCSIYDFIIDNDEPLTISKFDELQKTIYRWCSNDDGKNILYKRNGEERYPNFKLYKMIAKTSHKHTPEEQLNFPFFNQFLMKKKGDKNMDVMNLDNLPCYV
jgi:hypothetical protein